MKSARYQVDPATEAHIEKLLETANGYAHKDVIRQILVTGLKLMHDGAKRGDVKLINSALKEMRYAAKVFTPYRQARKVAIFGSARIKEGDEIYSQARELGRELSSKGYMVITGAGPGVMEAGLDGAGREHSFGVNIRLPFEQGANRVIAQDAKLINFKYFFTRKLTFVKESHAIVLFPGGFGTQDEGFEAITLIQTGKGNLIPIVQIDPKGSDYWQRWRLYVERELLRRGMISPPDLHLVRHTHQVAEVVEEIETFYSNYHSSRKVGDVVVLRIQRALSEESLARIGADFVDILGGAGLRQSLEALPEEANEPEIAQLPRLLLELKFRSYGRLRQLIDAVNAGAPAADSSACKAEGNC